MRNIIPEISSLVQYLLIRDDLTYTASCANCGSKHVHKHGCYLRKADRESRQLNPIPIQRFKCCDCGKTCSVLPECISPKRWYLWKIQQAVLLSVLLGKSYRAIAKELAPSRRTIGRWVGRLKEQFSVYADCLKSFHSALGYFDNFKEFWQECFDLWPLSKIMLILNNAGVVVP